MSKKQVKKTVILTVVCFLALFGLVAGCSSLNTVDRDSVGFAVGSGPLDPAKNKVKGDLMLPGRRYYRYLGQCCSVPGL